MKCNTIEGMFLFYSNTDVRLSLTSPWAKSLDLVVIDRPVQTDMSQPAILKSAGIFFFFCVCVFLKCEKSEAIKITMVYRLRNPALAEYSSSSSSLSTSHPLWAAVFFLFTCLLDVPRGLCMGTKRRKPGWALEEAAPREVVKVLNVQALRDDE